MQLWKLAVEEVSLENQVLSGANLRPAIGKGYRPSVLQLGGLW